MVLFNKQSAAMESALSAQWKRLGVIAHNIANEDTPGYQAKRVAFEETLAREIALVESGRSHTAGASGLSRAEAVRRLSGVSAQEYELGGLEGRADGNNVDILNEQTELARVQYQYQALRQRLSGYYSNMQNIIRGGR